MENQIEALEPQKIQEEEVQTITLTQQELDDLKHKAEVSSQNFERAKKAEAALKALESNTNNEVSNDNELKGEIKSIKDKLAKQEVLEVHPELKDKWTELEQFRQLEDNKGMNLKTAAKAFMVENGLLESRRDGLESKTGGDRQPIKTGMTVEEAEELRKNNHRAYQDALIKGLIPNS